MSQFLQISRTPLMRAFISVCMGLIGCTIGNPAYAAAGSALYSTAKLTPYRNSFACVNQTPPFLVKLLAKRSGKTQIPNRPRVLASKLPRLATLKTNLTRAKRDLLRTRNSSARRKVQNQIKLINEQISWTQLCQNSATSPIISPTETPTATPTILPPGMPTATPTATPTVTPTPFAPRSLNVASSIDFYGSTFMVSYYIISKGDIRPGEAAQVTVEAKDPNQAFLASTRIYDPSENEIYLTHLERDVGSPATSNFAPSDAQKLPSGAFALAKAGVYQVRVSGNSNARVTLRLPSNVGWGISFQNGYYIPFTGMAPTMYAFLPQHVNRQLRLTIGISDHASSFAIPGLTPAITVDGSGAPIKYDYTIAPSSINTGMVVPVSLPASPTWQFLAYGMPFILSRTAEDALAIGASVKRIESGPLAGYTVAHGFQEEIAEILPQMANHFGSGTTMFAAPGANYPATKSACTNPASDDDVLRHLDLLLGYGSATIAGAKWALGTAGGRAVQDINPQSPWVGSLGENLFGTQTCSTSFDCANGSNCNAGLCSAAFSTSADRWDRFQPITYVEPSSSTNWPLFAGRGPRGHLSQAMIWAAVTSHPCNPYGPATPGGALRYPGLFYRGVAAALSDLLMMTESEQIAGSNGSAENPYPGFTGFVLENTIPTFEIAAPYLNTVMPDVSGTSSLGARAYHAWKGALARLVNRHMYDYLVSSQNQSSHNLVGFLSFALGVQDPQEREFYELAARRYAWRFFASIRPAGYFQENTGLCSSYTGITTNMIGRYLAMSANTALGTDPYAEEALQTVYYFLNHTTAPEPVGRSIGAFNFNHRIGRGFEDLQYFGASLLADYLPEVGVWSRARASEAASQRIVLQSATQSFDALVPILYTQTLPWVPDRATYFTPLVDGTLKFPAEESNSFIRNFGNEYIAVKRPGYFTGIYVGKPAASLAYLQYRNAYRLPTTDQPLNALGAIVEDFPPESNKTVNVYNYNPYVGGGISLFWTPQYGNGVIGTSWSALAQQGLVAWQGGLRYWADYFANSFVLNANAGTLTVTGQIESLPLNYTRLYEFQNNQLRVTLTVTATQPLTLQKLVDVIPIPTCTRASCGSGPILNRKRNGAALFLDGSSIGTSQVSRTVSTASVQDNAGWGMQIGFAAPQSINASPNGMRYTAWSDELQIGRFEIVLPSTWSRNETHSVTYTLSQKTGSSAP